MELIIPKRELICIDYPGEVVNIDKAVETLGGIKQLHKAINDANLRLRLSYRPEDVYCKPAYGDRKLRQGLIVKIRRKKCDDNGNVPSELKGEILGVVDTTFTFTSLCDFQYLPMVKEANGTFKSIADELFVRKVVTKDWLSQPAPLFLQPPTFSRFDQPVPYCYRNNNQSFEFPDNCIGISRSRRPHFTMFFKFDNPTVPIGPHEESLKRIAKATIPQWKIALLKEKFEIHKIWSSLAIQAEVGPSITREDRKTILPTIAYHCADGPWRSMWVKFGYDMRKDPSAKIYQNLDYRQERGFSIGGVQTKRSPFGYHLPNTLHKGTGLSTSKQSSNVDVDYKRSLEDAYIFRPGITPKYRQIFYHLYNILIPEVQELIHLNDGQETECTEKDGWCLPNTIEKCRAIVNSYKNRAAEESLNTPKLEPVEDVDEMSVKVKEDDEIEKEFEVDDESVIEQRFYEDEFGGDDDDDDDDEEGEEDDDEDYDVEIQGDNDEDDDVENQGDNGGLENQSNYENLFGSHSTNLQDLLDQDKFDEIMKLVPSDDE